MYDEKHFTRDAAVVEFDTSARGITTDDDGNTAFDWNAVETVQIDNPPHAAAFDTEEFHKIPATVAKPIPQPYQYGEDTVWLKKPRDELKEAAWSLDNAPWTMGHPENGMVKDVDDVRGFWKNPRYIEKSDDLDADFYVPVHDDEAKEFIEANTDVSVGFYNRIARVDEYDGVVGGTDKDEIDIEGYQTNMLFDHCASVKVGRCSSAAGCGIDTPQHGHVSVVDAEHGTTSVMAESSDMKTGSWVEWDASGGTAYGKIDEIVRDGCTTRGKGDMEVCAEDGDAAVVVEVYDDESGESKDELVRHKMSELRSWNGPTSDAQPPDFEEGMMVQWQANPDMVGKIVHVDTNKQILMVELMERDDGELVSSGFTITAGYSDVQRVEMMMDSEHGDMDLTPPQAAQDNAQMALDARDDTDNPNDCGTETGWRRAEQLASGDELSVEVVAKMSQFERHQSNAEMGEEGRADCGWMMWKAWGGDEGIEWAGRMMDKMDESADSFISDTCITHKTDDVDGNMKETTDQPRGIYEADGMWFAVGPDEHPDESTEWPDDAKFPVNTCNDVRDAWNLRGTGDISIEVSTLEERIKRVAESKDCPKEYKPWSKDVDAAQAAADSAKRYSVCGSRKDVMELDDRRCGCTNTNETDTTMEINFDDLTAKAAIAKLESQHDGAEERLNELRAATDAADAATEAAEELGLDDVTELADAVAMKEERITELEAKVDELQRPQMEADAQFIAERTERFGEDAETVIDNHDGDAEAIADKRKLVEEIASEYDEQTANSGTDNEQSSTRSSGKYAKTPW